MLRLILEPLREKLGALGDMLGALRVIPLLGRLPPEKELGPRNCDDPPPLGRLLLMLGRLLPTDGPPPERLPPEGPPPPPLLRPPPPPPPLPLSPGPRASSAPGVVLTNSAVASSATPIPLIFMTRDSHYDRSFGPALIAPPRFRHSRDLSTVTPAVVVRSVFLPGSNNFACVRSIITVPSVSANELSST